MYDKLIVKIPLDYMITLFYRCKALNREAFQ